MCVTDPACDPSSNQLDSELFSDVVFSDVVQYIGVAARVKERMRAVASGTGPRRPILLFPEGTTTNGNVCLIFLKP